MTKKPQKVEYGMKTQEVVVIGLEEKFDGLYARVVSTKTGRILPELHCSSKRELEVGDKCFMYVFHDTLICNQEARFVQKDTPEQRIENILDAFEMLKTRYTVNRDSKTKDGTLFKDFTVPFAKMTSSIRQILDEDIKSQKETDFERQLENIEGEFVSYQEKIHALKSAQEQKEFVRKTTDNVFDGLFKLDLVWDMSIRSNLQPFSRLSDEGLEKKNVLSDVRNENKTKTQRMQKQERKPVQKTLMDF